MSVGETQDKIVLRQLCEDFFAGKRHSKIQYDPEVNQWTIKVMNNPNITASSYASINTKAIGKGLKIKAIFLKNQNVRGT